MKIIKAKNIIDQKKSNIATNGAWLCEYSVLNRIETNSIVVNSLLTILFSFVVLKEKLSKKSLLGLSLLTGLIVLIIVFGL